MEAKTRLSVRAPGMRGLALALGLAAGAGSLAACGNDQPGVHGPGVESVGLRATIDLSGAAVTAVQFDVYAGEALAATRVVPAQANLVIPGADGGPLRAGADAFFVLPPGDYRVVATPLAADGKPQDGCKPAEGKATVNAGRTTEIVLVAACATGQNGGLDVVGVVNHQPRIDDLAFRPSKFVGTCEKAHVTVTAKDADGDALTYEWKVEEAPPNARFELTPNGASVTLLSEVPGTFQLSVAVTDVHGLTSALSFPVHVTGDAKRCLGVEVPLPSFKLDPNVKVRPALPALSPNGAPRPVGALVGPGGDQAEFVLDEVVVATDDGPALSAFLARWSGVVVRTIDFADTDVAVPKVHLVRVQPTAADVAALPAHLRHAGGDGTGEHAVSSPAAMSLLAMAAAERDAGLPVSLNFVTSNHGIFDRRLTEAPSPTPPDAAWSPNVFDWPYMRRGGAQDIDVTGAWEHLAVAGRLRTPVTLAILDAGFQPDADFRPGFTMLPTGATGIPGTWGCSTGPGCEWHGTEVTHAAAAIPDNGFGVAGPGGFNANLVLVQSPAADLFQIIDYAVRTLPRALATRPRVANMSFGFELPAIAFPLAGIADLVFGGVRGSGILLVASAGNKNTDVDKRDCFLDLCWEGTFHLPCESNGITCVGGLEWDSNRKAEASSLCGSGSNFGSDPPATGTVKIFAPYITWVGATPIDTGPRRVCGTSFSAPFVAGVATQMLAANPALSTNQVEEILMATAHTGSSDRRVPRWVHASSAVRESLRRGPDNAPNVEVLSPADGARFAANAPVRLQGIVRDIEDGAGCCSPQWLEGDTVVVPGAFGELRFATPGTHTFRLRARDGAGHVVTSAPVTITITNTAPAPRIVLPPGPIYPGAVLVNGFADDPEEPSGRVACDRLTWTAPAGDSVMPATGCAVTFQFATPGTRTIRLRAVDTAGSAIETTASITVSAAPVNPPPRIVSLAPLPGTQLQSDLLATLSVTATDDDLPLAYDWRITSFNSDGTVRRTAALGNTASVSFRPSNVSNLVDFNQCYYDRGQRARVDLTVTDAAGNRTSRSIDVTILCILI